MSWSRAEVIYVHGSALTNDVRQQRFSSGPL